MLKIMILFLFKLFNDFIFIKSLWYHKFKVSQVLLGHSEETKKLTGQLVWAGAFIPDPRKLHFAELHIGCFIIY